MPDLSEHLVELRTHMEIGDIPSQSLRLALVEVAQKADAVWWIMPQGQPETGQLRDALARLEAVLAKGDGE